MSSTTRRINSFLPRDFVETRSGLFFAVVAHGLESDRVPAFLRYVRDDDGLRKVATDEANALLSVSYPTFLFHSLQRDVQLHGVPLAQVLRHHRPDVRLAELCESNVGDAMELNVVRAAQLLTNGPAEQSLLGVTGSVLVRAHGDQSDIDLVVYDHDLFMQLRERLRTALREGLAQPLDDGMWRVTFERRGGDLTWQQYMWHERRKLNKFMLAGTKVDLSYVAATCPRQQRPGKKVELRTLRAVVLDDHGAFEYPARYQIDDPEVPVIVSYNPTYTGQAQRGELIEASGWVELMEDGCLQLLVGTSRESKGEYLRVVEQS